MQSNVPNPFGGKYKFSHLNMPGGQWGQGIRLVSGEQHESHYTNLRRTMRQNWSSYDQTATVAKAAAAANGNNYCVATMTDGQRRNAYSAAGPLTRACFLSVWHGSSSSTHTRVPYSTQSTVENKKDIDETKLPTSRKAMLKKAVTEYGSTVIVFHIGISLISLGTSYLLVSG